jgi:uncharacterized protein (DUF1800 family)
MGQTLPAGRGIEDGQDVLKLLAGHPSTARFVAGKLVRRFVTDAPAPELVDELAVVFRETRGDLRAVTRALFTSERFYDERYGGAKLKTPFELVASALRLTRAELGPSRRLAETLRAFGHLPYAEPAPTGYPAAAEAWVNSGAMLSRMNFGIELAAGRIDGVRVDLLALADGKGAVDDSVRLKALMHALLPDARVEKLEASVRAELAHEPRSAELLARALGLILGSPDFQRR